MFFNTDKIIREYFTKDLEELPAILIGTLIVYIIILIYTRIFGLKSFSKMTGFDFVNTVAIGNLLAMSIATSNPTVLTGVVLIGLLYLFNYLISLLRFKNENLRDVMDNEPILLMRDGKILEENLEKTKVTHDELRGKLREANVLQLSEVRAVILETTGDVSVLHGKESTSVDDFILEGIKT